MSTNAELQEAVAAAQKSDIVLMNGFVDEDGDIHDDVVLREMLHPEEKILGSKKPDIEKVLRNCIIRLGPYTDPMEIREKVWPQLVKGDGDHLLIELRKLSLLNGNVYTFGAVCPLKRGGCGRETSEEFDLSEVGFVDVPDPELRGRREFPFEIGKHTIKFRHLLMSDAKMIAEISKSEDDQLTKSLALRLLSVDGETVQEHMPKAKTELARLKGAVKWLNKVVPAWKYREHIRGELKRAMARPDIIVETDCEHCGRRFRHPMPIDPTFLRPSLEE